MPNCYLQKAYKLGHIFEFSKVVRFVPLDMPDLRKRDGQRSDLRKLSLPRLHST